MANNNKGAGTASSGGRRRSVSHPRYSLQQVEKLARAAFDMGGRHCDHNRVAEAVGYKNATNGAYLGLKASALQFDLIESSGSYLSVKPDWMHAFTSEDPVELARARFSAMQKPQLYQFLIKDYLDRQLPSHDRLERELFVNQKYGILKDAASSAAQVFIDSAKYAGMIDANNFLRSQYFEVTEGTEEINDHMISSMPPGSQPRGLVDMQAPSIKTARQSFTQTASANPGAAPLIEDLDRIDIRLVNGKKAYLFVPFPLPYGEKERIKMMIDLLPEETSVHHKIGDNRSTTEDVSF